ncbi:MAG: anthranilate synthase component I family protein [Deferribacterota bacterium]|nr:anthranilate synthase component I family protein [Deferribacterota bacterium]
MIALKYDDFVKAYKRYDRFVFIREIEGDLHTPLGIIYKNRDNPFYFMLESANLKKKLSRYTYFGFHIKYVHFFQGDRLKTYDSKFNKISESSDPFSLIRDKLEEKVYCKPRIGDFFGGLVGFVGYDMINYTPYLRKKLNNIEKDRPIMGFLEVEDFFIYDNHKGKMYAVASLKKSGYLEDDFRKASNSLDELEGFISNANNIIMNAKTDINFKIDNIVKDFEYNEFKERVNYLKDQIEKGELIQVVLSNKYTINGAIDPLLFYRRLRNLNPSAYMFYLKFKDFVICGSSPETHLKITGGKAMLKPIAGTYPKDRPIRLVKEEILKDEKEVSEHLMLLDLARNDLSIMCDPKSIKVTKAFAVEDYSHVVHIVSEVKGIKKKGISAVELFLSTFPAGTVSGAPKVRAMELLDEVERSPRGFYAGCAGYFSYGGNLDSAIIIRSALIDNTSVVLRAGAGIVYDSDPHKEFCEVENKLRALTVTINSLSSGEEKDVFNSR